MYTGSDDQSVTDAPGKDGGGGKALAGRGVDIPAGAIWGVVNRLVGFRVEAAVEGGARGDGMPAGNGAGLRVVGCAGMFALAGGRAAGGARFSAAAGAHSAGDGDGVAEDFSAFLTVRGFVFHYAAFRV